MLERRRLCTLPRMIMHGAVQYRRVQSVSASRQRWNHLSMKAGNRSTRHGSDLLARLWSYRWYLSQCAFGTAIAWWFASDVLGHPRPYFAVMATVVGLGLSYGQRIQRAVEVAAGVAVGVAVGSILINVLGAGPLQVALILLAALLVAVAIDGGHLLTMQAGVQALAVCALPPASSVALDHCIDAVIGGAVAILVTLATPRSSLQRSRDAAADVISNIATLFSQTAKALRDAELQAALHVLGCARATDELVATMQTEASEILSQLSRIPWPGRGRRDAQDAATMVAPLDRALRSTRTFVRRASVISYRRLPVPAAWVDLCSELATTCEQLARNVRTGFNLTEVRAELLRIGRRSAEVERTGALVADVVLVQLRDVLVDLLVLTGLEELEATAQLPALDAA